MAWTTPRTWVAQEKPSASTFNTHLRDNLNAIAAAGITGWETYTPSWTSTGTQPAVVNGTLAGSFAQIGKAVLFEVNYTDGSSDTEGTGNYSWTLPAAAKAAGRSGGGGYIDDFGVGNFATLLDLATTTTFSLYTGATTQTIAGQLSPMTWTTSDNFYVFGFYEAA